MLGESHAHGCDVQDVSLRRLCASAAKSKAAMCEHTPPNPAIHVQWEHMIVPHLSAATQDFNGGAVTDCERLTFAVAIIFPWSSPTGCTEISPNQQASRYL